MPQNARNGWRIAYAAYVEVLDCAKKTLKHLATLSNTNKSEQFIQAHGFCYLPSLLQNTVLFLVYFHPLHCHLQVDWCCLGFLSTKGAQRFSFSEAKRAWQLECDITVHLEWSVSNPVTPLLSMLASSWRQWRRAPAQQKSNQDQDQRSQVSFSC